MVNKAEEKVKEKSSKIVSIQGEEEKVEKKDDQAKEARMGI